MFNKTDLLQFQEKGISEEKVADQINTFRKGFPYMRLIRAARLNDGIKPLNPELIKKYTYRYESARNLDKLKFVPASGVHPPQHIL
jgi:hypothetical protein